MVLASMTDAERVKFFRDYGFTAVEFARISKNFTKADAEILVKYIRTEPESGLKFFSMHEL